MKRFRLSQQDKKMLSEWGHPEEDFAQIQRGVNAADYECEGKAITWEKALELLGREILLSGISRAAFHASASRINNGIVVSMNLWKWWH